MKQNAEKIEKIFFLLQDNDTQLLSVEEFESPTIEVGYNDCSWFNILDTFQQKIDAFKEKQPENITIVAYSHLWPGYFHFEWDVFSTLAFKIDTNFDKGISPFSDYRRMFLQYYPYSSPNCTTSGIYYQLECLSCFFPIDLHSLHKELEFSPSYDNWKQLFDKATSINNDFVKIITSGNPLDRPDYSYLD